ncbi:conserved hypothetical protein [Leishmania major strain Friedlin]|uniref:Uncharacterized protein n=1 Tax=Leishmania major TaxID=5664 RepID=E9AF72_LEIMA|nr:conserved hypothetical protein [Leishmania major strain Friedlin]CAG9582601.1 hypothetical_protein_-_conserved [Leishmania major strain Friedlin]CBZ12876.1 conserved hypothetical protein [Leishmania major strain Friedlin]|eukprot:XP_003722642.1 conserved hypothetical protein [Leishmania major strain Friedlin]
MSFLFKAVLGQRVVHPPPPESDKKLHVAANGICDTKSSSAPATKPANASLLNTGAHGKISAPKPSVDAAASPSSPAGPSVTASASLAGPQSRSLSSSPSPPPPRPSTPTQTLLLRIEGCTVAQDIRDAQRDLLRCPDLPYALDATSLKSLLDLLVSYADDESITEPTLHLLANATDLDLYPDKLESNRRIVEVDAAAKRRARDALLQPLFGAVPSLLGSMKTTAPFWSRYYVVVLLQRLEELEPYKLNQSLLGARGIGVLLDALNEDEHNFLLRNQALLLLTSLTLADAELQTLLAFHNAFDSLFDVIQREGGVRHGRSIVQDCLTVVHNMLRSNKATQKFFREMGCAARLAALFDSVPSELAACTLVDHSRSSGDSSSPSSIYPQPRVLTEKLEALLNVTKTSESMLNVLMSVSILACVLRGVDEGEEERHSTQDALLRCGLLTSLARLAFCGLLIDDAVRIEAVRVLALLLRDSRRAVEEWLNLPPVTTLVRATLPYTVQVWPAPRALLAYVCESTDTTLVSAGVQLFTAVLSVPACQERSVGVFLSGLVSPTLQRGDHRGVREAVQSWATTTSPPSSLSAGTAGAVNADAQCGAALARVLLSSQTSAVEKFYTAQVLRALVTVPGATPVLQDLVNAPVPPHLQTSTLDGLVKAQPGWTLSSRLPPSFFNYTVTFVLFCLGGGAAAQQVNTAALGAYVGALLAWMGSSPVAAAAFVEEASWGETLLHQARRDGAAHFRLWPSVLVASACVLSTTATIAAAAPPTAAAAATALTRRFLQIVGGGAALDTILFDLKASTPVWQHPVASGLRTQNPTPYDEAIVGLVEQLVADFKQLLDSVAESASQVARATMALRPSIHSAQLQPDDEQMECRVASEPVAPPLPPPRHAGPLASMQQPPSSPALASLGGFGHSSMPPGNFRAESSLPQPLAAPLHPVEAPLLADAHACDLAALQAELEAVRAEKVNLTNALREWRERAEQTAAQCAALEKEQQRRAAAAAGEERIRLEDAATSAAEAAHSHAVSAEVVEELRENIRLLEEALSSKEEEHQQLVESLNMMEEQLRHVSNTTAAAASQQQEARQQRQHQQEQQHLPPPDVIAAMEAERNAVVEQLALSQEETARLQRALQGISSDYSELLLLVAELNEECVSVKAGSSVADTPARPWPEDAGLSLKRVVEAPHEPAVYDGAMTDETFFSSAEVLPGTAATPQPVRWEGTMDTAATGMLKVQGQEPVPTTQARALALAIEGQPSADANGRPDASMHAYEAAMDVTLHHSGARTPTQAFATPLPAQRSIPLSAAPANPLSISSLAVSQAEATPPSLAPLPQPDGEQQQHADQSPPPPASHAPPPPPPPLPATAHEHPFQRSALQAPRYPDLPTIFFGGGDGASVGAQPPQNSVSNAAGEQRSHDGRPPPPPRDLLPPAAQCSPQRSALSHRFPAPRVECALLAEDSPQNSDPVERQHRGGLVDGTVHDSARGVPPWVCRSIQETPVTDNMLEARYNTPDISATHHSAQLRAEEAPAAAVVTTSGAALSNPFLAGAGSPEDNSIAMAGGDCTLLGSGGDRAMGVEGARDRGAARWTTRESSLATNAPPQPQTAAAPNNSAGSTSEASRRGVPETESLEANNPSSTPTTAYNPFADLNASGDEADDDIGDLR